MHWLDITILAVLTVFALIGISRGLINQVFSMLALGVGLAAGLMFYDVLAEALTQRGIVQNESMSNVIAFVLLVVVFYMLVQMLGWLISKLIGTLRLGLLNRLAGGALGVVFGAVTITLFISSLSFFLPEDDPVFKESVLLPYLDEGAEIVKSSLPEDFGESLERAKKLVREEGFEAAMRIKDSDAVKEILGGGATPTAAPTEAPKEMPKEAPKETPTEAPKQKPE